MTGLHRRTIELLDHGHVVAAAEVEPMPDSTVVRAWLHAEAGHLPVGVRARLVDAVLDQRVTRAGRRLEATVPLGDAEALERLRARCQDVQARPAGSSCLVDATLPDPD
jgi:hypothetical protein